MYVLLVAAVPTVSLTSSVEEEAACPREEVTFTCTIEDGTILDWISEAFSGAPQTFTRFVVGDTVGQSHIYEGFTTTLTREIPDPDMNFQHFMHVCFTVQAGHTSTLLHLLQPC